MRVDLHAKVRARDGNEVGSIQYAIFDPTANDVTHFVVRTGGMMGRDVIIPSNLVVPPEIAEDQSYSEETVVLNLSKGEMDQMPEFKADEFSPPPADWRPSSEGKDPGDRYLWRGANSGETVQAETRRDVAEARKSGGSEMLSKGTSVIDRNGDQVGVIDELFFDTMSNDLRAIVVRMGGTITNLLGGGATVEVAKENIERFASDGVRLRASKEELQGDARSNR